MWFYPAIKEVLPINHSLSNEIQSFCIDSRKAEVNSLFFALKGERVDGHKYLHKAHENGAIAAVVEEGFEIENPPLHLIYVKDVKEALQEAAFRVIRFWQPKIIGVTGSLGKTSTKDFAYTLLSQTISISATPGNYNTQLTLPLTILNTKEKTDYLLLEMGIHRPGEIDRLLAIAPPVFSILTMIAHVHIGFFDSFKSLAKEKMKIFQETEKLGLYNLDMPFANLVPEVGNCTKVCYSLKNEQADYFLKKEGGKIEVYHQQKLLLKGKSPFLDYKSHYNLLAAIALCNQLKVPMQNVQRQLPCLKHDKNRLQKIKKKNLMFISDAYNANIDSAENVLMYMKENFSGRKIAVLSEMVHQGKYAKENHEKLAMLAVKYADVVVGYGPEMCHARAIWKKSRKKWAFFLSYSNMLAYISKFVRKGDTILLKGSRTFALERIIDDLPPT